MTADELPRQILESYLERQVRGFVGLRQIRRLVGGQSNPTFVLSADSGDYVLRRKPSGQLLKSAHAVDREYRVLDALRGSAVPVPQVFHFCSDAGVIGSEFYVMEYVKGCVFWDPTLPEVAADVRGKIYDEMNRVLAALQAVSVAQVGLSDFGRPGDYFRRQIRRWTEQYRAAETQPCPDVERIIEWLPRNLPDEDALACLVHGDFRLDNMIFEESGRVVALLDWELSTLGHPFADLAYQCAQWRLPVGSMRGLGEVDRRSLNIPTEAEYVDAYCRRRGLREIPHWVFHLVLGLFRLAAICQGVYKRALDKNASDPSALEFGDRTRVVAACAVQIMS